MRLKSRPIKSPPRQKGENNQGSKLQNPKAAQASKGVRKEAPREETVPDQKGETNQNAPSSQRILSPLEIALSSAPVAIARKRNASNGDVISLVVAGHVDSGKSTLMGHLLYLLHNVDDRTMHRCKQEASKAGKASFAFAWMLDEGNEERSRGVTMDVGRTSFVSPRTSRKYA